MGQSPLYLRLETQTLLVQLQTKEQTQGFHKMVVSAIIEVTTYGSIFDPGLRSSKYPFPSFSVSLPTRIDTPRFATPCETQNISHIYVNDQIVSSLIVVTIKMT